MTSETPDTDCREDAVPSRAAYEQVLFEQYKLAVEMANAVSSRRATSNAFFATVHTALLTILSTVFVANASAATRTSSEVAAAIGVGAAGIVLAMAWYLLLLSYRDLNKAKFIVIGDLEKLLPVAPFTQEWAYLSHNPTSNDKDDTGRKGKRRYSELGTAERLVPGAFAVLYLVAVIWVLFI